MARYKFKEIILPHPTIIAGINWQITSGLISQCTFLTSPRSLPALTCFSGVGFSTADSGGYGKFRAMAPFPPIDNNLLSSCSPRRRSNWQRLRKLDLMSTLRKDFSYSL